MVVAEDKILRYPTFEEFKAQHNRNYQVSQQAYRELVYMRNLKKVSEHNKLRTRTYDMELNLFSDLSANEFSLLYTNTFESDEVMRRYLFQNQRNSKPDTCQSEPDDWPEDFNIVDHVEKVVQDQLLARITSQEDEDVRLDHEKQLKEAEANRQSEEEEEIVTFTVLGQLVISTGIGVSSSFNPPPMKIDWTSKAGEIRYQGLCGSCYAFAVTNYISARYAIQLLGFYIDSSVQQLLDCPKSLLVFGCGGGFLEGVFQYAQLQGIVTESEYPYYNDVLTQQNTDCLKNGGPFQIKSFVPAISGSCQKIQTDLINGPVAVGIAARRMQFYRSGIFEDCNRFIDHALTIIGYGVNTAWLIKNSWGKQWGFNGYAYVKNSNTCGICNMAIIASIVRQ